METPFLVVVSGLPRSGTSLMMAALRAGGVELVTDGQRAPDGHNPGGYFEHERVKALAQDATWLHDHRGQAVKIIYRLLPHLPTDLDFRVIFLERDLAEVVASQQAMLPTTDDFDWQRLFGTELARIRGWLDSHRHLRVSHRALIDDPRGELGRVRDFLARQLDLEAMMAVVDPALHRQRR